MDITTLIDFFEKVETTEEYNGYFAASRKPRNCGAGQPVRVRNVSQIHHWAENARVKEFLKE